MLELVHRRTGQVAIDRLVVIEPRDGLIELVTFDAAAERLHLTPSAVSHGLKRLRRLMQDPLFLKTPKGVKPTERALALAAQPPLEAKADPGCGVLR